MSIKARDREKSRWSPEQAAQRTPTDKNRKPPVPSFASCDIGQPQVDQQDRSSEIQRFNQDAAATRWQVELLMRVDEDYVESHRSAFFKEEMLYGRGAGMVTEAIVDIANEQVPKWLAYIDGLQTDTRFEYITARGMIASDWDIAKQDGPDIVATDSFLFPQHLTEFVNIRVIPQFGTINEMAARQRILSAFLHDVFVDSPSNIAFTWTSESETGDNETKSEQAVFAVTAAAPPAETDTGAQQQVFCTDMCCRYSSCVIPTKKKFSTRKNHSVFFGSTQHNTLTHLAVVAVFFSSTRKNHFSFSGPTHHSTCTHPADSVCFFSSTRKNHFVYFAYPCRNIAIHANSTLQLLCFCACRSQFG